jgi:hypothetical protein
MVSFWPLAILTVIIDYLSFDRLFDQLRIQKQESVQFWTQPSSTIR